LFNSSATKLSSLTVNYEFNNKLTRRYLNHYLEKNPSLADIVVTPDPATSDAFTAAGIQLAVAYKDVNPPNGCDGNAYRALATSFKPTPTSKSLSSPGDFASFVSMFNDCFNKATAVATANATTAGTTIDSLVSAYNQAFLADIATFQSNLKRQLSGWDASAQYVFNKPVGQPETHDFRFVGSGDLSKEAGSTWTVNAAVSLYGSVPTGAQYGRLKDSQFSGELDKSLGSKSTSPSFSLAGYGQYQSKPSVLNITASSVPSGVTLPANAQVFLTGTQGWLGVVQVRLTLHLGSAQIPLAGKWSNKTDLLDKSKLGAQFGVSYDFSQLKQLIGLGSSSN
jgi:hypothetical protein